MKRAKLLAVVLMEIANAQAEDKKKTEIDLARDRMIEAKRYKVYYTNKFDLSGLPSYQPEKKVSGTIRNRPISIAVADLNGDGLLDLAVGKEGYIAVLINDTSLR